LLAGPERRIIAVMDAVDERIVGHLRADARASFAEIGQVVGLSAPAVKRRVDRLRAAGVIRGFTARVDPATLGWTTEAYVEVFCQGTVSPDELRRSLERIPEVVDACTVTGDADALLHLLAADIAHLEAAIERVRRERNVNHTRSVIVLSRLIDRAQP
jgi:DNA-binding Lrp family transcriptional regulator